MRSGADRRADLSHARHRLSHREARARLRSDRGRVRRRPYRRASSRWSRRSRRSATTPRPSTRIIYQFVTLTRGGEKVKMSTRKATYVTLDELIDEVGADVVRFFFLFRKSDSQLDFDLDLAKKQAPENPVFYVQYAHARLASVFREARSQGPDAARRHSPIDLDSARRRGTRPRQARAGTSRRDVPRRPRRSSRIGFRSICSSWPASSIATTTSPRIV